MRKTRRKETSQKQVVEKNRQKHRRNATRRKQLVEPKRPKTRRKETSQNKWSKRIGGNSSKSNLSKLLDEKLVRKKLAENKWSKRIDGKLVETFLFKNCLQTMAHKFFSTLQQSV